MGLWAALLRHGRGEGQASGRGGEGHSLLPGAGWGWWRGGLQGELVGWNSQKAEQGEWGDSGGMPNISPTSETQAGSSEQRKEEEEEELKEHGVQAGGVGGEERVDQD